MTSQLEQLMAVAIARLQSDVMFNGTQSTNSAPITIVSELTGEIVNQVSLALEASGICILVMTPQFQLHNPLIPSLDGYAGVMISVYENSTLNQTGIHAVTAAQNILGLLHFFPHGLYASPGEAPVFKSQQGQDAILLVSEGPPIQYVVPLMARITVTRPS